MKLNKLSVALKKTCDFHLDYCILPEQTIYNQIEIKDLIGYVPSFEIKIYGEVTHIFPMAEAILGEYGGYLNISALLSNDELKFHTGIAIPFDISSERYLMDWQFVCNYFNNEKVNTLHQLCHLHV